MVFIAEKDGLLSITALDNVMGDSGDHDPRNTWQRGLSPNSLLK